MGNRTGRNEPCPCGSGKKSKRCHETWPYFNKRFNRLETNHAHIYATKYGSAPRGTSRFRAKLKCRLVHGRGKSIIVPDLIVSDDNRTWFQPLAFSPPVLTKTDTSTSCRLFVDISGGHQLEVNLKSTGFLTRHEDGSELFECALVGPADLPAYATGTCSVLPNHRILLHLFHHTSEAAKTAIETSQEFRSSLWNIQGNKQLTNIAYVYLTPLERIVFDEDLRRIAMASDEKMYFLVDGANVPPIWTDEAERIYRGRVLVLRVYRESTTNRRHTVAVKVDAAAIAAAHLWMHRPPRSFPYYEVAAPYIHRVGVLPGRTLRCDGLEISSSAPNLKRLEYTVEGDATCVDGLQAPFDEEATDQVLKLERVRDGSNILEFWFEHGNQDLFSGKAPEFTTFKADVNGM